MMTSRPLLRVFPARGALAALACAAALIVSCNGDGPTVPSVDSLEIVYGFVEGDAVEGGALRLMSADGAAQRKILSLPESDYDPDWSPDGRVILFHQQGTSHFWLVNPDGTSLRTLPMPSGIASDARWSPDGAWLTFAYFPNYPNYPSYSSTDIGMIHPDGTGLRSATGGQIHDASGSPAWSSDGRIAFARQFPATNEWNIWTVDVDGLNLRQLTSGQYDLQPRWSPGSSRLAFVTVLNLGAGVSRTRIVVVNSDGSGRQVLTPDIPDTQDLDPSWSPDGQWILYSHSTLSPRPSCSFYKISASGGTPVPIVPNMPPGQCRGAAWRSVPTTMH
jgi:Tol biopolymer transport system component